MIEYLQHVLYLTDIKKQPSKFKPLTIQNIVYYSLGFYLKDNPNDKLLHQLISKDFRYGEYGPYSNSIMLEIQKYLTNLEYYLLKECVYHDKFKKLDSYIFLVHEALKGKKSRKNIISSNHLDKSMSYYYRNKIEIERLNLSIYQNHLLYTVEDFLEDFKPIDKKDLFGEYDKSIEFKSFKKEINNNITNSDQLLPNIIMVNLTAAFFTILLESKISVVQMFLIIGMSVYLFKPMINSSLRYFYKDLFKSEIENISQLSRDNVDHFNKSGESEVIKSIKKLEKSYLELKERFNGLKKERQSDKDFIQSEYVYQINNEFYITYNDIVLLGLLDEVYKPSFLDSNNIHLNKLANITLINNDKYTQTKIIDVMSNPLTVKKKIDIVKKEKENILNQPEKLNYYLYTKYGLFVTHFEKKEVSQKIDLKLLTSKMVLIHCLIALSLSKKVYETEILHEQFYYSAIKRKRIDKDVLKQVLNSGKTNKNNPLLKSNEVTQPLREKIKQSILRTLKNSTYNHLPFVNERFSKKIDWSIEISKYVLKYK